MNFKIKTKFRSYLLITIGALITATGLVVFMVPNKIAAGGVSGLATVAHYVFGFPVGTVILFINVPLFLVAVKVLGRHIGPRTLWGILVLSIGTDILTPLLPVLTHDSLLACLYGGALSGLGMGLVFRAGGTTGGTDLVASLVNNFAPQISLGQGLFIVDACVVTLAGIIFNAEKALYAAISIFIVSKVIDLVQEGFNVSKAAMIISDHSEKILKEVLEKMDRGVTAFDGHGGYSGHEKNILLVTVSRSELARLKDLIYKIDSYAFVILVDAHEVLGEGFKEWSK